MILCGTQLLERKLLFVLAVEGTLLSHGQLDILQEGAWG